MKFLTDRQLRALLPAETSSFPSPVPTQIVSSDEYMPVPQTEKQREVEARLKDFERPLAKRQGLSRRRFFQTAAGMAASFVAMNQVFGHLFEASAAEAATPDMADARAASLSGAVRHRRAHAFPARRHAADRVRQGTRGGRQIRLEQVARPRRNRRIDDLKYNNYLKEIYMDSDTKVALLSNSPSEVPEDWFIPQEQVFATRERVNKRGRLAAHAGAFHDHAGLAGLARPGRRGDRALQARFVEGLYGRRQHAQGAGATTRTGSTTKS